MPSSRPIVVAIDFGHIGQSQVHQAWRLAEQQSNDVHFLHVVPWSRSSRNIPESELSLALQSLQSITGLPHGGGSNTVSFTHQVRTGLPAREIVSYAKECHAGTILIGSRGRSRLAQIVLGSVAEAVIRDAPCPVLVIPDRQHSDLNLDTTESSSQDSAEDPLPFPLTGESEDSDSNRVTDLLRRAIKWRATDIHIDPLDEDRSWIRFRVDGKLRTFCHLEQKFAAPLMMQLKLMANFDTTQTFEPLEGRLKLPTGLNAMEVRVTIVPSCGGDAVAMRLLKHESLPRPMDSLGMSHSTLAAVETMLHHRAGLVLVTGPTGTGKTTTVYAMLQSMGTKDCNIVSIEDPVEYRVPGMRQLSVDSRHNLSMTRGLRTLLRMDPDVVFIGEIRDVEALEIAMRAGSSGRYVFSTLHTRDVASTITALRDLHADNFSLAGNLTGIVSQRLIRCLCRNCRIAVPIDDVQRMSFQEENLSPPSELYEPRGCSHCQNSGYRERIGVFEAVVADDDIVEAIQQGVSESELRQVIRAQDFHSLRHDALLKVKEGVTSLMEANSLSWM